MRGLTAVLLFFGLIAAGCGWSPPSAPPPSRTPARRRTVPATRPFDRRSPVCRRPGGDVAEGQGPRRELPAVLGAVNGGAIDSDSPQQVLFFDRNTPLGPATPEPRPYINVLPTGDDTAVVQYQWRQGQRRAMLPDRYRDGAVPDRRGRQAQRARPDPQLRTLTPSSGMFSGCSISA